MTRRITKNNMLVEVPAVPATPFIPGYEQVTHTWPLPLSDADSQNIYEVIGDWTGGSVLGRYNDAGTAVEAYISVPAVPATTGSPAYTRDDGVAAWNAGGSSVAPLAGNGAFEFYINGSPGGVVAGLATADVSTLPHEATHAIYVHGAIMQVLERGVVVHTFANPHSEGVRFVVRRTGTTVYFDADQPTGNGYTDESYVSATPITAAKVYLDAALYLSGDYVDTPSLLDGTSGMTEGAVFGALPSVVGRAGDPRAFTVQGSFAPVTGLVYRSPLGSAGFVFGSVPPMGGLLRGVLGSQATIAGVVAPLVGRVSNYVYNSIAGSTRPVTGGVTDTDPSFFRTAMSGLSLVDALGGVARMTDSVNSSVLLADAYLAAIYMSDSVFDALVLADSLGSTQSMSDAISSAIALGTDLSQFVAIDLSPQQVAARVPTQYAVNVLTGALTTYDGFDFNSFATTGQTTYGAKAGGVYRIRPGDDAGAGRIVAVDFGSMEMDTTTVKTIEAVFLGVDTDGDVYIRLVAGTSDTLYRVVDRGGVSKAMCARGVGGRQWNVSLEVTNATRLNLDMVELSVAAMSRRWSSR